MGFWLIEKFGQRQKVASHFKRRAKLLREVIYVSRKVLYLLQFPVPVYYLSSQAQRRRFEARAAV